MAPLAPIPPLLPYLYCSKEMHAEAGIPVSTNIFSKITSNSKFLVKS